MSSRTRLVALLLFGSGFCALIYQTTWLRDFVLSLALPLRLRLRCSAFSWPDLVSAESPWPDSIRTVRSLSLAETIAESDFSAEATGSLFEILQTPLCLWNSEIDRLMKLFSIAMHMDGDAPGERTAAAIEQYEPNVLWERSFLEARKTCYAATHNPRAAQAARDLDEFLREEPLTADVSTLTKKIEKHVNEKNNEGVAR